MSEIDRIISDFNTVPEDEMPKRISVFASPAEVKLLMRLRQIRKTGISELTILRTQPLIMTVIHNPEYLEIAVSGSAVERSCFEHGL